MVAGMGPVHDFISRHQDMSTPIRSSIYGHSRPAPKYAVSPRPSRGLMAVGTWFSHENQSRTCHAWKIPDLAHAPSLDCKPEVSAARINSEDYTATLAFAPVLRLREPNSALLVCLAV